MRSCSSSAAVLLRSRFWLFQFLSFQPIFGTHSALRVRQPVFAFLLTAHAGIQHVTSHCLRLVAYYLSPVFSIASLAAMRHLGGIRHLAGTFVGS